MKKTLTTALLALACSVYAYGLTEDDYEWTQEGYTLLIKANCTLSEALTVWKEKHLDISPEYRIQFGEEDKGIKLEIDKSQELPGVGEIDFVGNCELIFSGLYTLTSNPLALPFIYVGINTGGAGDGAKANLALTFSDSAIKAALDGKTTDSLVTLPLVEGCMFGVDYNYVTPPNTVSFKFDTAEKGDVYEYSPNQSYTNKGLVDAMAELERNTAVLYFAGSDAPVGTGFQMGTFTVAFVGSHYDPVVPEPSTGTLSLLALAGLCARRRRK